MAPAYGARDSASLAISHADFEMPWQLIVRVSAIAGSAPKAKRARTRVTAAESEVNDLVMTTSFWLIDVMYLDTRPSGMLGERKEFFLYQNIPVRASCTQRLFAGMKLAISKEIIVMIF